MGVLFRDRIVQTLRSGCIVNHLITHKHNLPDRQLLPQKAICFYVRFSFSNHFSFQRQSIHTSELFLGILFQLQVIFSIGNYLYFRKKNDCWKVKIFYPFSQFILVVFSYMLIKYFIHSIATIVISTSQINALKKKNPGSHCSLNKEKQCWCRNQRELCSAFPLITAELVGCN